jgi:hypothetical protein
VQRRLQICAAGFCVLPGRDPAATILAVDRQEVGCGPAQNICCTVLISSYVATMNWQQLVSLAIVGVAAALLLRKQFRRRKFSFARDTHCCGCGNSQDTRSQPNVILRARKGERPQMVIKMQ